MANFIISAFADEYSTNFDTQIEALKSFKINHIEVRGVDGENISAISTLKTKEIAKKLNENGIKVSAIGSPLGKVDVSSDVDAHIQLSKNIFEKANILGAKFIRIFSFYNANNLPNFKELSINALGKMLEVSKPYGVTLCLENEAKVYGESPDNSLEILKRFNGEIKAVFDMGNFVLDGFNAFDAYKLLKDYIAYFHVKDARVDGSIVPYGEGDASIKEILNDYKKSATSDFITTLEPHLQTFDGLKNLTSESLKQPFVYDSCKSAFTDAVNRYKNLIK